MHTFAIQLDRCFDVARLRADLEVTTRFGKVAQYGGYHNGDWTGLSLRSEGGEHDTTRTGLFPSGKPFEYTAVVRDTPYFKELLESFSCPQRSVRLLHLSPGGRIETHVDSPLTFQHGILRLHIPIVTHPDVEFVIGGQRCSWRPGELWWGDFSQPHHVYNNSPINRVHLVMDVEINDYVLGLFPAEFPEAQRHDGILLHRDAVRLALDELRRFECDVEVPADAVPHPELQHGCSAQLRVSDDRLALLTSGKVLFKLDPVGDNEFAIVGWSRAVTLRLLPTPRGVESACLIVRGLPKAMFRAASADNPRLAINEIPFVVARAERRTGRARTSRPTSA